MIFRSITFKLWLTLALVLVFSLGSLLGLTHYSMQKRFLNFSFEALQELLPPLEHNILALYSPESGFKKLQGKNALWKRTLQESLPFNRSDSLENIERAEAAPDARPDRAQHTRRLQNTQRRFLKSLTLFDSNKERIVGNLDLSKKAHWHPLKREGQLIAYIAFEKPKTVLRRSEESFLQQQFAFFLMLSGAMLIAAVFLSALISRWFLRPIRQLSQHARAVAKGDFKQRIHYQARDELGEFCQNFNYMTEKLDGNEDARKQWFADISHEMRTPLAVIRAQIEAMQDGIRPANKDNIALLAHKTESLNRLIDDLSELALSDVGALSLELRPINIGELLDDFIETNRPRAINAKLDLRYTTNINKPLFVQIDRQRLMQVLDNIFENSLRYTDSPGDISCTLKCATNTLIIEFEDSAPGVDAVHHKAIFTRLFRVEQSRNRALGGAGIGLALSKNLIEAQNGSICAGQSQLGGLKISIHLPIL